jgi:hypothetical protein
MRENPARSDADRHQLQLIRYAVREEVWRTLLALFFIAGISLWLARYC